MPCDSLVTHWDCLFDAVCERLRAHAHAVRDPGDGVAATDLAQPSQVPLHDTLLDCVSALEQLRAARIRLLERGEPCAGSRCVRCRTDTVGRRS